MTELPETSYKRMSELLLGTPAELATRTFMKIQAIQTEIIYPLYVTSIHPNSDIQNMSKSYMIVGEGVQINCFNATNTALAAISEIDKHGYRAGLSVYQIKEKEVRLAITNNTKVNKEQKQTINKWLKIATELQPLTKGRKTYNLPVPYKRYS